MKKRIFVAAFSVFLFLFPVWAQSQPERILEKSLGPRLNPGDLRVLQLGMNPDPVRENQRVSFYVTLSNRSQYSGRVGLFIKDRDEVVVSAYDVLLRPGDNRISFPLTDYRFSRNDHCFSVEVDIEKTRRPIDVAREFCARRAYPGWTMSAPRIGPFFVEDLDMVPDPVSPGQDIRFKARLRNDGNPMRVDILIQDHDQIVTQLNDAILPMGLLSFFSLIPGINFNDLTTVLLSSWM